MTFSSTLRLPLLACIVTLIANVPCSAAACAPSDDGAYTDMSSTWIQTIEGTLKEDRMAVFSAEFRLFCKSEPLKGAALKASIVYRSGSEAYVPKESLSELVVLGNSTGSYQLSFALPEHEVPAGEYKAEISLLGSDPSAAPLAAISLFHSVPLITGRHMEILALLLTSAQAYYVATKYSAVN